MTRNTREDRFSTSGVAGPATRPARNRPSAPPQPRKLLQILPIEQTALLDGFRVVRGQVAGQVWNIKASSPDYCWTSTFYFLVETPPFRFPSSVLRIARCMTRALLLLEPRIQKLQDSRLTMNQS